MPPDATPEPELPSIEVDRTLAFARPETQKGYTYWKSCCGTRSMPARADISPAGMREFIQHVGLLDWSEQDGKTEFHIRLAGARIEQLIGAASGKRLHDIAPPVVLKRWNMIYRLVCDERRPFRFSSRMTALGKDYLASEVLVAPLSDDGKTVSMLFGVLVAWPVF
ncbi:MAG TPA: PAS domain-containing protein [Rhizomicrobium sp.]